MTKATSAKPNSAGRAWVVVAIAALTVLVSLGIGRSFGLFLSPVSETLGTGREVFSLAIAVQSIILGLPLAGMVADRIGAKWVMFWSALLLAVGLYITSRFVSVPGLFVGVAVLGGLALSGTGFVVALGAVGRAIAAERRSFVFGLITASASVGILVMAIASQAWIESFGWQTAMALLAAVMVVVAALTLVLPGQEKADLDPAVAIPMKRALSQAKKSNSYLLLIAGFFVCGFHVSFIGTHLPSYLEDGGLPSWVAPAALGLIGLFNIGGSFLFGALGDRYRKRTLLTTLYFSRALIMTGFLLIPLTATSALVFSALMGVVWLGTVPLTSGIVAVLFGTRYLSTLFGFVFLSHQIGAFSGVWLGGRIFDTTGSYTVVWLMAIGLGILAALIHLPIKESPVPVEDLVESSA